MSLTLSCRLVKVFAMICAVLLQNQLKLYLQIPHFQSPPSNLLAMATLRNDEPLLWQTTVTYCCVMETRRSHCGYIEMTSRTMMAMYIHSGFSPRRKNPSLRTASPFPRRFPRCRTWIQRHPSPRGRGTGETSLDFRGKRTANLPAESWHVAAPHRPLFSDRNPNLEHGKLGRYPADRYNASQSSQMDGSPHLLTNHSPQPWQQRASHHITRSRWPSSEVGQSCWKS